MGKMKESIFEKSKKKLTVSTVGAYNQRTQFSERKRDIRSDSLDHQAKMDRYIEDMIRKNLY